MVGDVMKRWLTMEQGTVLTNHASDDYENESKRRKEMKSSSRKDNRCLAFKSLTDNRL